MRPAVIVFCVGALFACGGTAASSPADAGAEADVAVADAYSDSCEKETTHDVCLATAGCAWYSAPLCTDDAWPFPINPGGCYAAALGANPQCFSDADCGSGLVCVMFGASEECGAETVCPGNSCEVVGSSWCRVKSGT